MSGGEILRLGLWMTAVAYVAILLVALPYWGLLGQPLARVTGAAGAVAGTPSR